MQHASTAKGLMDAKHIQALAYMPWLMIPGGIVIIVLLALNFAGGRLRDAADPKPYFGRFSFQSREEKEEWRAETNCWK
jgi:hypothetical protein